MLLLMSFVLQIWMKLMVLMLLMMSNLTIMTMMKILMMIRPGEGGTFYWLANHIYYYIDIIISIIIRVMIVNLLIISSISTINFIHICNMSDINNNNNNIAQIDHNGGAIMVSAYMLLMSFMLQIWMKLMVLMLLMMSNLTIMTMMMILMMIRPGEGGTFCWLASQPAGRLAGRGTLTLSEKNLRFRKPKIFEKNSKWVTIVHFLGSLGVLTPTSILIFIAAFHCGLQKLIYIDLMQVL